VKLSGQLSVVSDQSLYVQARRRLPACCVSTFENLQADSNGAERIQDLVDAVQHEMTLYAEDQDGCITAKERSECGRYLRGVNGVSARGLARAYERGRKRVRALVQEKAAEVLKLEINSADRQAIKILLTVPHHSDAFHSVLQTASLSAIHEAYLNCSGSRRAAIGEKLEELMSLALPHPQS
jgi:hypothetical protein